MAISKKKLIKQEIKRVTIVHTAKELFLKHRYSDITMDVIADKAGITKRTLYTYYPSKLALFIHIFDEYLQTLQQKISKVIQQSLTPEKAIMAMIATLFEFTKENERFMQLYWTLDSNEFEGVIPDELMSRIKIWTKASMDETRTAFIQAQSEGIISKDYNPDQVIHLISAVNKGIFIHTNKENKFEIANIDPSILYQIFKNILSRGLFERTL